MVGEKQRVSVIIPTHLGRRLDNPLDSVYNSTYKSIELIVVDDKKERSMQRNIGYARSTGEYLLFLDSDMTIHPNLIEECVVKKEYDGLYIPEIIVNHPIKTMFRKCFNGTRIDAIRFIKREYFIPFDTNITGFEDWDFDRRFKGRKGITCYPLYHHTNKNILDKMYCLTWLSRYIVKQPKSLLYELNPFYRLWLILKRL